MEPKEEVRQNQLRAERERDLQGTPLLNKLSELSKLMQDLKDLLVSDYHDDFKNAIQVIKDKRSSNKSLTNSDWDNIINVYDARTSRVSDGSGIYANDGRGNDNRLNDGRTTPSNDTRTNYENVNDTRVGDARNDTPLRPSNDTRPRDGNGNVINK